MQICSQVIHFWTLLISFPLLYWNNSAFFSFISFPCYTLFQNNVLDFFIFPVITQLKLVGHCYGLSIEETKDLWVQADIDGNGILDFEEFQV